MASRPTPPPDNDPTRALRALGESLLETQQSISQAFTRATLPSTQWVEQLREQIATNQKALIEPALRAAKTARELLRHALPVNWQELEPQDLRDVITLAELGVVALVWVPRLEITSQLAAAADQAQREQILISNREQILADVETALADSTANEIPQQDEARDQAQEAHRAAVAGLDRAAQTLFAAALGHVLEGSLGFPRPGLAFKKFKETDLDEAGISELRLACLQIATVNALTDTDQRPDGFNRHGTQHGSPAFFSEASMLGAALLVAGWIRELSWLAEHHPEAFREA